MPGLQDLTREASALATGATPFEPGRDVFGITDAKAEVARVMGICNACRYCEGFCAVFPALTRRLELGGADIHYLANLCHGCGACLHACQYATPHEFAVNVPQSLARVRLQTYAELSWPRAFGTLYRRNGSMIALALAAGLGLFLMLLVLANGALMQRSLGGNFYAVFSHRLMIVLFGIAFGYSVFALAVGMRRFWCALTPMPSSAAAIGEAFEFALRLKYLDGGHGLGCNERDDRFTLWRRRFHHATFYGFLLCFASTIVATLYHYAFGWQAPYALTSVPVLLGTLGGIGLLFGPAGLLWLDIARDARQVDDGQHAMDRGFIILLLLTSATGFALLICRESSAMALLLVLHLGVVMALFVTLPYGKFAHATSRLVALVKWSIERRQPNPLALRSE